MEDEASGRKDRAKAKLRQWAVGRKHPVLNPGVDRREEKSIEIEPKVKMGYFSTFTSGVMCACEEAGQIAEVGTHRRRGERPPCLEPRPPAHRMNLLSLTK